MKYLVPPPVEFRFRVFCEINTLRGAGFQGRREKLLRGIGDAVEIDFLHFICQVPRDSNAPHIGKEKRERRRPGELAISWRPFCAFSFKIGDGVGKFCLMRRETYM